MALLKKKSEPRSACEVNKNETQSRPHGHGSKEAPRKAAIHERCGSAHERRLESQAGNAKAVKRNASGLWIPDHLAPARKTVNVVFWFSKKLNHIRVGLPEMYPIPRNLVLLGYDKIVCRSAAEVQKWSQKMRDQERIAEERTAEERDKFEGPLLDKMRKDLLSQMANARNAINRDFLKAALAKMDEYEERRRKEKRESMMHQEAFEDGH